MSGSFKQKKNKFTQVLKKSLVESCMCLMFRYGFAKQGTEEETKNRLMSALGNVLEL